MFWFLQQKSGSKAPWDLFPLDIFSWKGTNYPWNYLRLQSAPHGTGGGGANIRPLYGIAKLNCFPNFLAKVQNQQYKLQTVDSPLSTKSAN